MHGIKCRVKKLTVLKTTNNNQSYGTDSWAEELFMTFMHDSAVNDCTF